MRKDEIQQALERYGEALSTGEIGAIADFWALPSLVVSDQGAIAVTERSQVEQFFGGAAAQYTSQGIVATRPQLEDATELGAKLVSVDVRWSNLDATDAEKGSEHIRYLLEDKDGSYRIRLAVMKSV